MNATRVEPMRQVISAEQIQKRVKELARQISDDYRGQTIQILAVLENAFMFQADLVRALEVPVVCQFIKPKYTRPQASPGNDVMEIFFSHEPDIQGKAHPAGGGAGALGRDQRVPDERSASQGGGIGEAGDAARPASRRGACRCNRTISGFWWTRLFWSDMV